MKKSRGVALLVIGFLIGGFLYALSQGGVFFNREQALPEVEDVYQINETWTLDKEWKLTITGVTATEQRDAANEKDPAQVIIITYDYENIGNAGTGVLVANEMTLDLSSGQIIDAQGQPGYAYTLPGLKTAAGINVGEKFQGAQVAFGLDNISQEAEYVFRYYDVKSKYEEVGFHLVID